MVSVCDKYRKFKVIKYTQVSPRRVNVKTLYIDVYFLINFTVDLLSLYFGALTAKVKSSVKRLIIASFLSASFACLIVLLNLKRFLFVFVLILNAVTVTCVFCGKISFLRKTKLFIAFLFFETLIGGFVTFIYGLLDRYFYPLFDEGMAGAENKNLILLAFLILMVYGILHMLLIIFGSSQAEKNVKIKIVVFENEISTEALVDSGNMLCDPFDSSPVVIVKRVELSSLIGDKPVSENEKFKARLRLIPAKSIMGEKIFIGIRSDYIIIGKTKFENTVIAVDDGGGSFGGYSALLPAYFMDRVE